MCDQNQQASTQSIADYLAQLLKDRKQLAAFPNVFIHVERLLDEGKKSSRPYPLLKEICVLDVAWVLCTHLFEF